MEQTDAKVPALEGRGVCKTFTSDSGKQVRALVDVNFSIPEGEFTCIVGPSGHGKSTLLFLMAGLLQPTAGELMTFGRKIDGPGSDRGLCHQQDTLFLWKRVVNNVGYGLKVRGVPKSERERKVAELLRIVGLQGNERSWPKELSGGMRKRVQVATVFASNPSVLLMDEPFGSLDYVQRHHLHRVLLALWRQTKKTIVFVSHDVEEVLLLSDRILVVAGGRLVESIANPLQRPRDPEMLSLPQAVAIRRTLDRHLGLAVSETQHFSELSFPDQVRRGKSR